MTWRSIESDPPEYHAFVWLANAELKREQPVEFITLGVTKLGWTHWSPCEPPADLPPAPKTAFEEWVEAWPVGNKGSGTIDLQIWGTRRSVTTEVAKYLFNAGLEWRKAKG